jgi:hypothetical protein
LGQYETYFKRQSSCSPPRECFFTTFWVAKNKHAGIRAGDIRKHQLQSIHSIFYVCNFPHPMPPSPSLSPINLGSSAPLCPSKKWIQSSKMERLLAHLWQLGPHVAGILRTDDAAATIAAMSKLPHSSLEFQVRLLIANNPTLIHSFTHSFIRSMP